ncbi:MAG: prepilin-type N-terminal cleavage/methylation domain-containing protein [Candidatus Aminicenantales bacterium]
MRGKIISMKEKRAKKKGFTLVEVLLTVMILAVALTALLTVFVYGFHLLSRMNQIALATQAVQEETEYIRTLPYDDILNLGSSFEHENLSQLENGQGLITLEDSVGPDIKKLTVSVVWTYRGRQLRKDITTYITREGIDRK